MEKEFWGAGASRWPADPSGYVFLARGVHEIGKAMFGDAWTGKEPMTTFVPLLSNHGTASPGDKRRAHNALMITNPEYARKHNEGAASRSSPRPPWRAPSLDAAQWSAAQAAVRLDYDACLPAAKRLATVQGKIVEQCEAGNLAAATRPVLGGAMSGIPPEWWNTEHWQQRFSMCQLNRREPFGLGFTGDDYCWIFLTRESLDRFLSAQTPAATAGQETRAIDALAIQLKDNPQMSRQDAKGHLRADGHQVGKRAFDIRIWPVARTRAGLPPLALPGRKRKSPR